MLYTPTIISIIEVILVIVPVLLIIAFVTVAERKTMASMQRRLGPNIVGYYGLLQSFADALKLILKEYISPTQANLALFFLGPIITLIFSLLGYAVVPYGPGLVILDFNLGILYTLAVSSLTTYGILLAGWSANSKYAFLGSLRSTAQLISYSPPKPHSFVSLPLCSATNYGIFYKLVWLIFKVFVFIILYSMGSSLNENFLESIFGSGHASSGNLGEKVSEVSEVIPASSGKHVASNELEKLAEKTTQYNYNIIFWKVVVGTFLVSGLCYHVYNGDAFDALDLIWRSTMIGVGVSFYTRGGIAVVNAPATSKLKANLDKPQLNLDKPIINEQSNQLDKSNMFDEIIGEYLNTNPIYIMIILLFILSIFGIYRAFKKYKKNKKS